MSTEPNDIDHATEPLLQSLTMEPLIPDGSLCLFRFDVAGSRIHR